MTPKLPLLPRLAGIVLVAGALVCASALGAPSGTGRAAEEPLPGDYRIVKGRVDRGTYNGWRLFHSSCHGCHGVGAVGTDIAPSLVERIKTLTPRGFATKVLTSYRIVPSAPDGSPSDPAADREALLEEVLKRDRRARGQPTMPAWDGDADVPPHVLDLYAYLSARADGELGPGKPRVIGPKNR